MGKSESFSCSNLSITDFFSSMSPLDNTTRDILEIINKVAIIAVDLVRKFPTVLVEAKLSCDKPRPSAPPSDLCSNTSIITVSYTHLTLPTKA